MNIVVAGGTGFIGRELLPALARAGHSVVALSRRAAAAGGDGILYEQWDGRSPGAWSRRLDTADAVVNLTGESVAGGRWTEERKRLLTESRLRSTAVLVEAMARARRPPSVFVNASASGYYGDVPEGDVTEDRPPGQGFLPGLSVRWEEAALRATSLGVRVVLPRMGVVLGEEGGALRTMVIPFRLFVGGAVGSGEQWVPWIHRTDVAGGILHLLESRDMSGPANFASPGAVRMKEFARELGRVLARPSWIPAPAFAVRLLVGEMADVVLTGQKLIPSRLLGAGYRFRFPVLESALRDIFRH